VIEKLSNFIGICLVSIKRSPAYSTVTKARESVHNMEGRTRSSRQKLPTPTALPTKSAVGYATTTTTTAKPKAAAAAVVGGVKNTKSPTTHVQVIAVRVGVVSETRHFGTVQACLLQGESPPSTDDASSHDEAPSFDGRYLDTF
jgi:hypothetical protein